MAGSVIDVACVGVDPEQLAGPRRRGVLSALMASRTVGRRQRVAPDAGVELDDHHARRNVSASRADEDAAHRREGEESVVVGGVDGLAHVGDDRAGDRELNLPALDQVDVDGAAAPALLSALRSAKPTNRLPAARAGSGRC